MLIDGTMIGGDLVGDGGDRRSMVVVWLMMAVVMVVVDDGSYDGD